jgi:hypothetical protein
MAFGLSLSKVYGAGLLPVGSVGMGVVVTVGSRAGLDRRR